jgi:hypothetical protein
MRNTMPTGTTNQTTLDGSELSRVKELERFINYYRDQFRVARYKIRLYKKELRMLKLKLKGEQKDGLLPGQ